MKFIDQVDLNHKRIFVRVDFNVPLNEEGQITDDTRIKAHLPTLKYCLEKEAKIIVGSHMGRPKGQKVAKLSLKPVAARLSELIGKPVTFVDESTGEKVEKATADMNYGDIILLENLRFNIGDEKNDSEFAKKLAALCDVYIDDAFAFAHRKAASNTAITEFVKVAAAGFLLKNEIEYFSKAMENPDRPFAAIIGGAKVSDKIGVLESLIDKVNMLIVGGGMAFTFLKAQGNEVGKSLCEDEMVGKARSIMEKAKAKNVELYLPVDCIIAKEPSADAEIRTCSINEIPEEFMGLDIGPETVQAFDRAIRETKTIVWNGPMGMFELKPFSEGTFSVARSVAESGALSIIGGGDTDAAVHKAGVSEKISYISTGGGAFLELLEGKVLPAIDALQKF